ncbi:MAG: hypothetical protein ACLQDY_18875 [Streptosporangiaceae bacterium]
MGLVVASEAPCLGRQLVETLFSIDDVFVERRLAGVVSGDVVNEWDGLLEGRVRLTYRDILASLEGIDETEPTPASLTALRAYLAWDCALASGVISEPATEPAWQTIAIPVLRTLMRAGALWAPRQVARAVVDYLASTWEFQRLDDRAWRLFEAVEKVAGDAERRLADRLAELAMDLHDSLHDSEFRAGLAALFWTMGDVPRAQALRSGRYQPSYRQVRRLVTDSFARIDIDPLVQYIWIYLEDLLPLQLHGLHYRLRTVYHPASDALTGICAAYASALVSVSRMPSDVRGSPPDVSALFGLTWWHSDELRAADASVRLRVLALMKSATKDVGGLDSWEELVSEAASAIERQSGMAADADEYDVSMGIPCHYLTDPLVDAVNVTEAYRCAALWYWRFLSPRQPADERPGADERRRRLRILVSGARFAQSAVRLPRARLRIMSDPAPMRDDDRDISDLLTRAADPDRIAQLTAELATLADEDPRIPAPHHPASVEQLANALNPANPNPSQGSGSPQPR